MVLTISKIMMHHCTLFVLGPVFYGVVAGNKQVDHKESINRCQNRGGLAPSSFFNPIPETVNNNTGLWTYNSDINGPTLNEGGSAWDADYAVYSLPVYWKQCSVHENAAKEIESCSIYNCLKTCGYNKTSKDVYIGVSSKQCACLNHSDVKIAKLIECDPDNSTILGVYGLVTGQAFDDFSFQCNTTNGTCSEKHGIVCTRGKGDNCTGNNHTVVTSQYNQGYCLVNTRNSWRDSVRVCKDVDTHIVNYSSLISNRNEETYWVGTFKSFIVVEHHVGNHSPCLFITSDGETLILEPEDCTELRLYICSSALKETSPNDYYDFVISIFVTIGGCLPLLGLLCVILYTCTKSLSSKLDTQKEEFHNFFIHNRVKSNYVDDLQLADIGGSYATIDLMSFAQSRGQVQDDGCSSIPITNEYDITGNQNRRVAEHPPNVKVNIYSHVQFDGPQCNDVGYDTISRLNKNGGEADAYDKVEFNSLR